MKRILSLALALVMLLGVMVPQTAFAAKSVKNYVLEVTITDLMTKASVTRRSGTYSSLKEKLSYKIYQMVCDKGVQADFHEAFNDTDYLNQFILPGIEAYESEDVEDWDKYIFKNFVIGEPLSGLNWAYLDARYFAENLVFQTVLSNQDSTLNSLRCAHLGLPNQGIIKGYFKCWVDYGKVFLHTYEVKISLLDAAEVRPVELEIYYEKTSALNEKANQVAQTSGGESGKEPLVLADASNALATDGIVSDSLKGSTPSGGGGKSPMILAGDSGNKEYIETKYFSSAKVGSSLSFSTDKNGNFVLSDYGDGTEQSVVTKYIIEKVYDENWNEIPKGEWIRVLESMDKVLVKVVVSGYSETTHTLTYQYNGNNYVMGAFPEGCDVTLSSYKTIYDINGDEVTFDDPIFYDEDDNPVTTVTMDKDRVVTIKVSGTVNKPEYVNPQTEMLYTLVYQDVLNGTLQPETYIIGNPCKSGTVITLTNPDSQTALSSGYTFGGWYYDDKLQNPVPNNKITMPAADMVIYAKWTKSGGEGGGGGTSSVTLTFDVGSGGSVQDQNGATLNQNRMSVNSGTTVNLLNYTGVREGYTFNGWYADAALTKPLADIKMDSSKTVYAKWIREVVVTAPIPGMLNGEDHFSYLIGYEDNGIHPNGTITRAEVATIFFRLLKDEVRDQNFTRTNSFNDVKEGSWYNNAISTMAKLNIVNGYADGGFHPNGKITRAEFAAIVSRFDALTNTQSNGFTDIIGHWAEDNINQAANNGWVYGYQDGTFGPNRSISRAETVTLINRVLHRLPATTSDLLDGMKRWPDNSDTSAWYYIAMQEATNSHTYDSRSDGSEKWRELRENRDWAALER